MNWTTVVLSPTQTRNPARYCEGCNWFFGFNDGSGLDPRKDIVGDHLIEPQVVVRFAIGHAPVEVVVPHRNHRQRLYPGPAIQHLGLLVPPLCIAAVQVVDHEQKALAACLVTELTDQRGAYIAANVNSMKFKLAHQLQAVAVIGDLETVSAARGAEDAIEAGVFSNGRSLPESPLPGAILHFRESPEINVR